MSGLAADVNACAGYIWEDELPGGSKKMLRRSFAQNGAYIAAGNLVTLADGSYQKVEVLKVNDVLMTSAEGDTKPVKVSRDMHPMELTAGLTGFGEWDLYHPQTIHRALIDNRW